MSLNVNEELSEDVDYRNARASMKKKMVPQIQFATLKINY